MARKFLTNLDLTQNEVQNLVIHTLATAPATPVNGQVYFNSTDNRYYIRQPTGWKDITGRLDNIMAASGATYILLTDNGDGTISLDVASATGTSKGLMSSADKSKLDAATDAATPGTLVIRDASGDVDFHDVTVNSLVINETQNSSTPGDHAVSKSYVDTLVSSGMKVVGSIDCSTNPDYPAANTGEAYYVSVAGRIGGGSGPLVKPGDLIVAVADSLGGSEATAGNDFIIIERNLDSATETTEGYVRLATSAEVAAGTGGGVVTADKLAEWWGNQDTNVSYGANIGLGDTTKIFLVNHALNTTDVHVQVRDTTTLEVVEPDIVITDANNVTVKFNKAPALNQYRVVVLG